MVDLVAAGFVARHFRRRAEERGGSGARVGILVFLSILACEVAGIIAFGKLNAAWDRGSMLIGAIIGVIVGIGAGFTVGGLMTSGPVVPRPEENEPEVAGRECFECQTTIERDRDGKQCKRCRHAIHERCRAEHRIAHRRFDAEARELSKTSRGRDAKAAERAQDDV